MTIKVAITDDHVLIMESLERAILSTGYIEVCGRFFTGEELVNGLVECRPDVLLLDYHLPDQGGMQLIRHITGHYPDIKIIVLTGIDKPGLATELLEAGCMGYLMKSTSNTGIITQAIGRVYEGQIFLDTGLRNRHMLTVQREVRAGAADAQLKLTQRETEILRCIAEELSSQEIADRLCLSKRTVDNHRNSLMIKSGAKNMVGLIKFAYEQKLI